REISIPMKNPTSLANSEISFRVTELGYDNDSLKKEFWFQEPYNHVIDTNLLVGDTLRLRMLPGAMKMLNVEVLTPTDVVSGTLEYSNQTKLVAFPCDSNYNAHDTFDIGKVRYHAVYSRRSNLMPGAYYNVYYKRSKPMNRFDKLDKVDDWEDEHQLNDSVFIYDCSQVPDTAYSLESNYPSLVVRCDTINNIPTPMVYVVYQAIGGGCIDSTKIRIIENVFPANTATIITMARQIADVHADVEIIPSGSRFGIPVINASSNGNYYAWNDSLKGIVAGFKTPGQRGWIPPNQRDQFKIFSTDIFHEPHAYHPSLNTYSTISADEMDCALVWEESWSGIYRDQFNQIFYTRLKYCPLTGLSHYVTKEWSVNDNWYKKAIYNIDSTIVRLDDPSAFFQYLHLPTVYRDVEYYNAYNPPVYNGMWPNLAKTERIYYQGRVSYLGYQQGIFMKFISTGDSFNLAGCPRTLPMNWMVEGPSMILSANKDLAHPNVVQGKLVKEYSFPSGNVYYSGAAYVNDSSLVINFVEYPHNPNLMAEVPRTADIWQINHGYFSLFYGPFSYDYGLQFPNNTPKAHRIGSQGKYSHLARLPYINNDKTWEYGHRIFESSSDPFGQNPQIMSYDYLLCKKSYDAEANYIFYGFEDTLGNRSVFSPIYMTIDGRDRSYVPRFDKTNKIYSDTLYSEYFEIGNYQDIDMLQFGSNKKCLDLKLQRKDDKKLFSVQTDKSSERFDYTKHNIHLGNGKSKEYRFAWIKTTKSDFTVMTILGLPPMNEITKDEMLGKTSINVDENYLDLSSDMTSEIPEGSSLSIYPNPAKEKVMIFYEQERKSNINISIYGMLGSKIQSVFSGDIDKGKYQYSVNTKDIPAGIYFVRVEGNNKTIVKKLVIE
ncbi:MAG: T9SS type A sorting domain-containing protein, partial [bacterium]